VNTTRAVSDRDVAAREAAVRMAAAVVAWSDALDAGQRAKATGGAQAGHRVRRRAPALVPHPPPTMAVCPSAPSGRLSRASRINWSPQGGPPPRPARNRLSLTLLVTRA